MFLCRRSKKIIDSSSTMINSHLSLAKLIKTSQPQNGPVNGNLVSPLGGAATHAFFQTHHFRLYHKKNSKFGFDAGSRNVHCSCCDQNLSSGDGPSSTTNNLDPETRAKLEVLKKKLATNTYYEKYKEKFLQMESSSPLELLAKLEQLDSKFNSMPKGQSSATTSKKVDVMNPKSYAHTKSHNLDDVMKVESLRDLEKEDIIHLWQEFHRKKEGLLAAVMSSSTFEKMSDMASNHPIFVLPLPRENGHEFFLMQYMDKSFHFTPLLAYQTHKENAPECLRLVNYTDLQRTKDLVLMRGEYDKTLMTQTEAHIMAVQVNFYFGEISESRKKLLESFTSSPQSFNHVNLIEEFNKIKESNQHLFEAEENVQEQQQK